MSQHTIRAVLFDFGGVLAEEGFRDGLQALAREQRLDAEQLPRTAMQAAYDSGFVLGRGTAAQFWALLRQRSGLAGDDTTLTRRILAGFVPRPAMIALVERLRANGFVTAILSDQTHWLDALDQRHHFMRAFDHVYNSYHLGKGKRDPSLFADVAADLALPPGALLFIDDDAGNVDRAREAGYQALLFTDQQSCISELQRLLDHGPATPPCSSPGGNAMNDQPDNDSRAIRVECYAGHRADTEPLAFHLGERRVAVTEIIDRWLDPAHRYFKLRGDDGGIYLLRHDTVADRWELILYDSGRHDDTRLSST